MGFLGDVGKAVGNAGSSVGQFIPGIGDAMAAEKQNSANIKAANTQMDFQERLSNTAYQRAMEDMKAAGLNPMLAFSQGGASTPTGALPTINSETKTKLGEFALSAATGIKGTQTNQQQANTAQMQVQSNIDLAKTSAAKQMAETENTRVDTEIKKKDLPVAKLKGEMSEKVTGVIRKLTEAVGNSAKSTKGQMYPDKPLIKVPKPH